MDAVIISCEHGGNRIPAPYPRLFSAPHFVAQLHHGTGRQGPKCRRGLACTTRRGTRRADRVRDGSSRFAPNDYIGIELEINDEN